MCNRVAMRVCSRVIRYEVRNGSACEVIFPSVFILWISHPLAQYFVVVLLVCYDSGLAIKPFSRDMIFNFIPLVQPRYLHQLPPITTGVSSLHPPTPGLKQRKRFLVFLRQVLPKPTMHRY
jgi:hypothetical protein